LPTGINANKIADGSVTSTEFQYIGTLTNNAQTQINGKAATGTVGSSGLTMNTARLLGRTAASSGAVEEITVGSGLSLSAGQITATGSAQINGQFTGTVDAANATIKMKGYIVLAAPMSCDQTGAVMQTNDITKAYFGQVLFSDSADETANYCEYRVTVPEDIDTSVEIKCARLKVRLGGADTGTQRYVLSMASVADSSPYTGTVGNAINLDFAGDGSAADGDVETVGAGTTLTSWNSKVTAGDLWVIRLARDGDALQDASTMNSYSGPLVIEYGITQ
jgi:hypothetical protein